MKFLKINNKNKKGVTLLELLMVLGIVIAITINQVQKEIRMAEQEAARSLGNDLYRYSNAIREYMSDNYEELYGAPPSISNPLGVPSRIDNAGGSLVIVGTNWLKDGSCPGGTGTFRYINCGVTDVTGLGRMEYRVTFTKPSPGVVQASHDFGQLIVGGKVRQDLAALAALTASGHALNSGGPSAASATASFLTDARGPATVDRLAPFGHISMVIDTNASSDAWLRTDGQNQMQNNLGFNSANDPSFREIVNVSRLRNTNATGDQSQIRFLSAMTFDESLSANLRQLRNVREISNVLDGQIDVVSNLNVIGQLDVAGNTRLRQNLQIDGNTTANGTIIAQGRIESVDRVVAPIFVDRNDNRFFVDPNALSRMRNVELGIIRSNNNVDPNRVSIYANVLRFGGTTGAGTTQAWQGRVNANNLLIQLNDGYTGTARNTSLAYSLPRYVNKGIYRVRNGDFVRKPTCPTAPGSSFTAVPRIVVTPSIVLVNSYPPIQSSSGRFRINPNWATNPQQLLAQGMFQARATNSGANWGIVIGPTVAKPGQYRESWGLATVYCQNY